MKNSKLRFFGAIAVIALVFASAILTVSAQQPQADANFFAGWDCSNAPAPTDLCVRKTKAGDTAWDFGLETWQSGFLWTKIREANPTIKVVDRVTPDGKKVTDFRIGTDQLIYVKRGDLNVAANLQKNDPLVADLPATQVIIEESPWRYAAYVGIPLLLILGIIALAVIAAAVLYVRSRNEANERLRSNPLDPEFMGQPMRSEVAFALNREPSETSVRETFTRLERNDATMTNAAGSLERTVRVRLTVPAGMTVPTEFRNGAASTRPIDNDVFLGIYYDRRRNIVNVVGAFARCENGLLFNRMSSEQLGAFVRNATWSNPRVVSEAAGLPRFSWQDVLTFLRAQGAQATQAEEVQAQTDTQAEASAETAENREANEVATAGSPVAPHVTEPAPAVVTGQSQGEGSVPKIAYSPDGGLSIVGGVIDLGKGAKLDLTGGGTVNVDRSGQMTINEIPFERLDAVQETDSTN